MHQYFNSQPHKEADKLSEIPWTEFLKFQFTASQGGWRDKTFGQGLVGVHFNSQPHKEADFRLNLMQLVQIHFNSQPHKEADEGIYNNIILPMFISIHSLTRRLTAVGVLLYKNWDISIHSLTRRLTAPDSPNCPKYEYFNSQPHKEADCM